MKIELFSFFSGLGLLDLGFENIGFDISFVNECNESFIKAYKYARRNKKHIPFYGYSSKDVREFLSDDIWFSTFSDYASRMNRIIGFIGGPPCPDFSTAGKNIGSNGENGQLTSVYIDLIIKRKPDFFLFENVAGLYKTKKHRKFYDEIKLKLIKSGYNIFDSIENSLEYGVPQYRNRLFLLGFHNSVFHDDVICNIGSHKKYNINTIMELPWPKISPFSVDSSLRCPKGIYKNLTVEYWFIKNKVQLHPNQNDIFSVKAYTKYASIAEGETGGKSFKRLHRWRYAPTSAYGNNEVHLHPYKLRRISVAEALSLQSAPANFSLPPEIPLSSKFKMVGNGVPVLLSQGIAKDIMDTINSFKKGENCNV